MPKRYKQRPVPGTNRKLDRKLPAKPVGWRTSDKTGNRYFEDRENRSDTDKERRYYQGVNRKSTPNKPTGRKTTRTASNKKTTPRVAPVRKRDPQKPRILHLILQKITRNANQTIIPPTKTKILSATQLEKIIREECLKIHTEKIEHLVLIDLCGNVIYRATGNSGSCPMPDNYRWYARNHKGRRFSEDFDMKNLVCIHNHPGASWHGAPTPFSHADIQIQVMYEMKEWRVVARGYMFRSTLSDDVSASPSALSRGVSRQLDRAYSEASAAVPQPNPEKFTSSADYTKAMDQFDLAVCWETVEKMNKYLGEYLQDHGITYSRSIFTKKGLVKK